MANRFAPAGGFLLATQVLYVDALSMNYPAVFTEIKPKRKARAISTAGVYYACVSVSMNRT